ncbi:thioredoxin-like domain-containing protein [Stenotrophomonas maltophilia]|uniref:thioredoxin-like domain-containing protein n=1 Tax=Stenotrophomonas maltophilia TaxID=40324 RepID=UPI0034DB03C7
MRSEPLRSLLLACAVLLAAPAMATDLHTQVSASLMRPEQRSLRPVQWSPPPRLVALYFGADWCGPCHAFVPTLRSVRDALRQAGADTEVVYVSLDESEAALRRYMQLQDMPWPVLDPRRAQRMPALQALAGPAPPNLVLIDADGRVLANGWQGHRYEGLQPVLKAWTERACAQQQARCADGDIPSR